jgi:hypothetical protein
MVIGLLAITAIPTVTGIALGCSEQRKQNKQEDDEKRMAKFYTDVECFENEELHGKRVVLRDNKVRISCKRIEIIHTLTIAFIRLGIHRRPLSREPQS